ncbi:hypothetical protein ES702_03700 [subsurface metagenome]
MVKAPKHLSKSSRDFFNKVSKKFELKDHHIKILNLKLACECLDRIEEARLQIEKDGAYHTDRFGQPKSHPALQIEKDNKIIFDRLIRELNLDIEPEKKQITIMKKIIGED